MVTWIKYLYIRTLLGFNDSGFYFREILAHIILFHFNDFGLLNNGLLNLLGGDLLTLSFLLVFNLSIVTRDYC